MILRNLLRRPVRTLLTIAGIAIGVAAVVAMGAVGVGMLRNYGGIFSATNDLLVSQANSYDVILSTLDESYGDRIGAIPGVEAVEPGVFTFLATAELPAFMIFGFEPGTAAAAHYRVVEGRPVSASRQIIIGHRAADDMKKGVGDTVRLYGTPYKITGIYETGQGLEETGGLVTLEDAQELWGKPNKVSLFQIGLARNADPEQVVARIERLDKELTASEASEYDASEQWAGMIQGFAWGVAGIAVLIGGLGMMNAMVMSVLERTREIGTLRALGWTRRRVVTLVMGEALVLSLAGGVVGLLLGVGLTELTGKIPGLGVFFEGAITPGIAVQALITGLVLGMVGGLFPAWQAANLQPVEALRYEGGGAGREAPTRGITGWLARNGGQSFRNLWRRRNRTLISAAGVAIGVMTLVMLGSIVAGLNDMLNKLAGSGGAGAITVMQRDTADMSLSNLDERIVGQIRSMPGVKAASPMLLGFVTTADMPFFIVQGIDPNSAAMQHYKPVAGRAVQRPNEIMLGKAASEVYKAGPGSTLTLMENRYKVVGLFETGVAWEEGGGLLALRESQRLLDRPRGVSFVFVDAERPELAEGLIAQMNARFPDARASLSSNFAQNTRDMQSTQALGDAIGVLAMLVGGVVVANTMLMTVYERTREIGTLRALGWGRRKIVSQVVVEGLLLCLLAAVMGAALGWLLINLLTSIPVLDSYLAASFDVPSIVRAVALALLVGLIGSAYPAWRASRLQPVEALRYE